jgi:hypothetical protein
VIDWDEMPWNILAEDEMAAFEERLADEVEWLLESRHAEVLLTGQEP